MLSNTERKIGNYTYLFTNSGAMKTGWQYSGGKWYSYRDSGTKRINSWYLYKSNWYYFDENGVMVSDEVRNIKGATYIFDKDGTMRDTKGWKYNGGYWYYYKNNGSLAKNSWVKSGNSWYYFDDDCRMIKNESRVIGGKLYLFGNSGAMKSSGWSTYNGHWIYMNSNGSFRQNQWLLYNNRWYYFDKDGAMISNKVEQIGGKKYFFGKSGAMERRWCYYDGDWYYGDDSGALLQSRWRYLGNKWYFLKSDGKMASDEVVETGNERYYFAKSGIMQTGKVWVNGQYKFFKPSGQEYKNSWIKDEGKWYYIDGNYDTIVDQMASIGGYYYGFDKQGVLVTDDWYYANSKWHYANPGGSFKRNAWLFDKKGYKQWYYLDENTNMASAEWKKIDGTTYYFYKGGTMAVGEATINGQKHYFKDSGAYIGTTKPSGNTGGNVAVVDPGNTSGGSWVKNSNGSYSYKMADGSWATGYKDIKGYRYYFDNNGILKSTVVIDVSQHNGNIDWNKVRNSGVSGAIIRSSGTFAGPSHLKMYNDDCFTQNIVGAKNAGLKVGVYHYSQAIGKEEGRQEAQKIYSRVKNYSLDLPIIFDMEFFRNDGRTHLANNQQRTDAAIGFCEEIKRLGGNPGLYANLSYVQNSVDMSQLRDYPLWMAQYYHKLSYNGPVIGWQYSSSGSVPGINGRVDMNVWF